MSKVILVGAGLHSMPNLGAIIAQAEAIGVKVELKGEEYRQPDPITDIAISLKEAAKQLEPIKYREPDHGKEWWRGGRPR